MQLLKEELRVLTCGSEDGGKSTLLGRLFSDLKTVFEDQRSVAEVESGNDPQAYHDRGMSNDVAYSCFETERRRYIAADPPGHAQYTRNMVIGATFAEVALILVDVRKGIQAETRRHIYITSLLGIKHIVLVVNKMDLVEFEQKAFQDIASEFNEFVQKLEFDDVQCVPLSALGGENVSSSRGDMDWYGGPALIEILDSVEFEQDNHHRPFRMPVQSVNKASAQLREISGTIASGTVSRGDQITVHPSGAVGSVAHIVGSSGDMDRAVARQAITLVLDDEIDVSRGDLISSIEDPPETTDQFAAHVIWFDKEPMLPERTYVIRFAASSTTIQITDLVHRIDVDSLEQLAAKTLRLNETGYCKLATDRAICFDPYSDNRDTGAFVLIDKLTNATVGAGIIDFALRRASNIAWHDMKVGKAQRVSMNSQEPCMIWFTGFSGSGKSTIADRLEQKLYAMGKRTYLLDGDNVRHGLNKDLGFTDQDRVENIRRVAETAKLIIDAGLIVLVSFISPFRSERRMARELVEEGEFVEVFVDTPLEVCEDRDPKGLYKKARAGDLKNFTGIDSDYEVPDNADITVRGAEQSVDQMANQIIEHLQDTRRI